MVRLIYDYIGKNDSCKGIEEEYPTRKEAVEAKNRLKNNTDYCNFEIEDDNDYC
jgi:hypothetical protein